MCLTSTELSAKRPRMERCNGVGFKCRYDPREYSIGYGRYGSKADVYFEKKGYRSGMDKTSVLVETRTLASDSIMREVFLGNLADATEGRSKFIRKFKADMLKDGTALAEQCNDISEKTGNDLLSLENIEEKYYVSEIENVTLGGKESLSFTQCVQPEVIMLTNCDEALYRYQKYYITKGKKNVYETLVEYIGPEKPGDDMFEPIISTMRFK